VDGVQTAAGSMEATLTTCQFGSGLLVLISAPAAVTPSRRGEATRATAISRIRDTAPENIENGPPRRSTAEAMIIEQEHSPIAAPCV
jgi:hypothetical protein